MEIIECKKCGVLFSNSNKSIKSLYKVINGYGQHAEYLECSVCKHKTIIRKDWSFYYDDLKEIFGEDFTDTDRDD